MISKVINRLVFGGVVGVTVGFLIALGTSLAYQSDTFMPSGPAFVGRFSTNTQATLISAGLWALMGVTFSVGSFIFETAYWSITKQTAIHLLVTYALFTPLALLAGWFPLNNEWLVSFSIEFLVIYLIMWIIFMTIAKARVRKLNEAIKKDRESFYN